MKSCARVVYAGFERLVWAWDRVIDGKVFCLLWLKLILKFVSVSLDFSLSFHHGEGDEEGRGGGAADEEGHAPCDESHEGR